MRCSLLLLALSWVVALTPVVSACSPSKVCTLLGCESAATIRMFANVTRAQMETATITACRNTACSSGRPTTVPSAPNDKLQLSLSGALSAQGYLTSPDPVKGFGVEARFPLDGVTAQNGDVYELRVTLAGATSPVVAASDKATYEEDQPNGSECPPVCRTALIQK